MDGETGFVWITNQLEGAEVHKVMLSFILSLVAPQASTKEDLAPVVAMYQELGLPMPPLDAQLVSLKSTDGFVEIAGRPCHFVRADLAFRFTDNGKAIYLSGLNYLKLRPETVVKVIKTVQDLPKGVRHADREESEFALKLQAAKLGFVEIATAIYPKRYSPPSQNLKLQAPELAWVASQY
ncbi:MAG: hypothetical protein ABL962_12165, partial [Fimbriimonadaceae bacterium]